MTAEAVDLLMAVILGLLALVVLHVLLSLVFWRLRRGALPYVRQPTLNSPAEQAFYSAVSRAVGSTVLIACKVRIADVLRVRFRKRHARDQRWWRYFRLISSKHVDLVLCEPRGGRILIAIELDDRTHGRADRKRRDRFVDRAFASAGIPLVRFPARGRYDVQEIRAQLAPHLHLTPPEEGSVVCQKSRSSTP
ncbi:DUF2726 domain-containing protein [Halomonas huangheensis]|uniref:DUF2726 domain-containing protein n=1 Tax=Halomonas huangheensis TaxID=1178482 RepID=W1NAJ6_9GAMM|nr:DUF2726 domain-containing protein [Halomonas huangheensis]ALM54092.1 hypothetical protein AR456_18780 [Halomonas huangheensis]ERL52518.1 hypothetical protein BJB45_08170 [Halomonas huangheensis]